MRTESSTSKLSSDNDLLDFLERHATTGCSFDQFSISFDVPDSFTGADSLREVIQAALEHHEQQNT